mgnify:CR=1 FL=1
MSQPARSFYNLAWRWHFYAGLFVIPFLILLSLTGIIYLFKPQLDPLLYRDLMVVEAGHHRQPADTLLAEVHKAYPQGHVGQYLPPLDAERSGELLYVATLPITPSGKWQLVVSDASKDWKLRATLELPASNEIKLGY